MSHHQTSFLAMWAALAVAGIVMPHAAQQRGQRAAVLHIEGRAARHWNPCCDTGSIGSCNGDRGERHGLPGGLRARSSTARERGGE